MIELYAIPILILVQSLMIVYYMLKTRKQNKDNQYLIDSLDLEYKLNKQLKERIK